MVWTKLHWTNNIVFSISTVSSSGKGLGVGEFSDNIKKSRKQNFLIDRITFAWCEGIEWKDINGHILTTNLRYSQWLTFFSSKIPGRGDLGLGEIKGRNSSTSFRNSTLLIQSSNLLRNICLLSYCATKGWFVRALSRSASSSAVFSWTTYNGSVLLPSFLELIDTTGCFSGW